MFRNRQEKKLISLSILIAVAVLLLYSVHLLKNILSKSVRVKAEILLVEGWIPPSGLKRACEEFSEGGYKMIVTTGLENAADYFDIYSNGTLVFNLHEKFASDTTPRKHIISIRAFSSMGGSNISEFDVFVNSSKAGSFSAGKRKKYYNLIWTGRLSKVDSVSVRSLNYGIDSSWERTLFVREIVFDNSHVVPYMKNSSFYFKGQQGIIRTRNDFVSYADFARANLIALGIDSSSISAVPCKKVYVNRTLESALAFREWLKSVSIDIKGINIITIGVHAGRTRMTYNKVLANRYNIGIISLPDYRARNSWLYDIYRTIRETIEIIYYRIILFKY